MTYEEVRKDYNTLLTDYDGIRDYTGIWQGDYDISDNMLGNPTKTNAKKIMIKIIVAGFRSGEYWEGLDETFYINEHSELMVIYNKYC